MIRIFFFRNYIIILSIKTCYVNILIVVIIIFKNQHIFNLSLILIQFAQKVIKVWSFLSRDRQPSFYLQRSNDLSHVQSKNKILRNKKTKRLQLELLKSRRAPWMIIPRITRYEMKFLWNFLPAISYYYHYRYHRKT